MLMQPTDFFAGDIKGLESIWFVGDEFMNRSFSEHMKFATKENGEKAYVFENYKVHDYSATKYTSNIRNILGRI